MFQRIFQLFKRYADQHLTLEGEGFALLGHDGEVAGYVDLVSVANGRLVIEGWTDAREVVLSFAGTEHRVAPSLPRIDVAAMRGADPKRPFGFVLDVAWMDQDGALSLMFQVGRTQPQILPRFSSQALKDAHRQMIRPFVRDAILALPDTWRWYRHGDHAARQAVKRILGLQTRIEPTVVDSALLLPALQGASDDTPVTIIIPVYNAFDLLAELLNRVALHTDVPHHIVLIDDCSPDPRVRPFLRGWVQGQPRGSVSLIENVKNRGFVGSVNAGFDIAAQRNEDVILLNSDAMVPSGWASRLMAPIRARADIASVTPMSNDAEIFTAPHICERVDIVDGAVDVIDARARCLNVGATWQDTPTGVGFCMAMSRHYLNLVPQFDTVFGRGYGEEVDWCQKARANGGYNVAHPGLFVQHKGAASFGSAEKLEMIQQNNQKIVARYPSFDAEVQDFIRRDPLATARLALGMAVLEAQTALPIPIYLAHSLGGGAEIYLQCRLEQDIIDVGGAVVLRVGGVATWDVELVTAQGSHRAGTSEFKDVEALLAPLTRRRVIYSCGVGHVDPVELPARLSDLATPGAQLEILMNDYFPISPSFNLLDKNGKFSGVPDEENTDDVHTTRRPDGTLITLADWRAAWRPVMAHATEVRVFSKSGHSLVMSAFPEAARALRIVPHTLPHDVPRLQQPKRVAGDVIGVLGNIGFIKGAAVLADLSKTIASRPNAKLVVLGNVDPDYPLAMGTKIHGGYKVSELPELVARYGITMWLIPSICPETFSFTTHEALATGLPVWTFDLGAQAEAVSGALSSGASGGLSSGASGGLIKLPKGDITAEMILAHVLPEPNVTDLVFRCDNGAERRARSA
ncbi:glycosyltransferase [uncultured Tateyamaria sp.]|uniref:glycosyltransferase n=1 Tax=uncultured Tateyamaria sp. TaxID=455651 RepID=UPI00263753B2|nr:glycosyltransferase [uncultured Tateyamaria sp.]